ncbi:MAG: SufD family Fe-S cluster assembly protein [Caulobacterales bacterium]|jgi:Fe-S cluster assembly protein SufD
MSTKIALPTRRDEAWKWSDLKAAYGNAPVPALNQERAAHPVIVQLAAAADCLEHVAVASGESALRIERMQASVMEAKAVQIDLADGANLTRIVIQDGPAVALNLARVKLGAGASFRQFVLALGSKLARIETHVEAEGALANVELNGVYLCGPGRHADLTSQVLHNAEGIQTRQLIKGAVRAGGRGVFQGKLYVARAAQKTDAQQHHHALLLEEGAEVYAKPELEIYADDVACAHGNTTGSLDEEALFYLRSRAIPLLDARRLLIEAFLLEALPDGLDEALTQELQGTITTWLGQST